MDSQPVSEGTALAEIDADDGDNGLAAGRSPELAQATESLNRVFGPIAAVIERARDEVKESGRVSESTYRLCCKTIDECPLAMEEVEDFETFERCVIASVETQADPTWRRTKDEMRTVKSFRDLGELMERQDAVERRAWRRHRVEHVLDPRVGRDRACDAVTEVTTVQLHDRACGHAPRSGDNARRAGSRRSSSGGGDPSGGSDPDPEPRVCECRCGASLDHLRADARFLNAAHRGRAFRAARNEKGFEPLASVPRPCDACPHPATLPDEDGDQVCILCGTLVGVPSTPNGHEVVLALMITDADGQRYRVLRRPRIGPGRWGGLTTRLPSDAAMRPQPVQYKRAAPVVADTAERGSNEFPQYPSTGDGAGPEQQL